jgi:hypothetical protein
LQQQETDEQISSEQVSKGHYLLSSVLGYLLFVPSK